MSSGAINGFNIVTPVYDNLANLVFGRSIRASQLCFVREIEADSRVLIIGGGTGWLLTELLDISPTCEVWYIEASSSMLEKTRKRISSYPGVRVHFVHGTDIQFPVDHKFDIVLANFFFDMFTPHSLKYMFSKIRSIIGVNGKLLVSDFLENPIWWQRIMLAVMYRFFVPVCSIEASGLPDWQFHLQQAGLVETKSALFYRNFIKSSVYMVKQR